MRTMRIASLAVLATSLAASAVIWSCTPAAQQASTPAAPAAMTHEQKVAHGKYLTVIMSCIDCHTPGTFYNAMDTTRTLSGSELGWTGPWGTTFPRNLTPDSTGIGAWTEDEIVTALRQGHRPDNSPILPPMPWTNFGGLTDDDAYSIAAYLKSLPPIHHVNLKQIPSGMKYAGAHLTFPPPPAWDVPPPAAAAK